MSKIDINVNKFLGLYIAGLGFAITVGCLVALFNSKDFDFITFLVAVLLVCGATITLGGIKMIKSSKEEKKYVKDLVTQIEQPSAKASNEDKPNNLDIFDDKKIIASWEISAENWQKFSKIETSTRRLESIGMFIGIVFFGTIFLVLDRQSNVFVALIITTIVGLLIYAFNQYRNRSYLASDHKNFKIYFTNKGVLINKNFYYFFNDMKWLDNVVLNEEDGVKFIQFTVKWETRYGVQKDDIRVPYDNSQKESEINLLKDYYNSKTGRNPLFS